MTTREGASVSRPPLLEGSNYNYWKARMRVFINSLDELAWFYVENEWSHPTEDADTSSKVIEGESSQRSQKPKDKSKWTPDDLKESLANSKALNAIFTVVDENQFKLISTCHQAKKAWDILQTVHEGTSRVRESKLQMLATKFEELKMEEDDTIATFNGKLRDISNMAYQLGKVYKETKLVKKTLRSLPKRFAMKVAAIEEARDVATMSLDELMGSLQTYEMTFQQPTKRVSKELAFKSSPAKGSHESDSDDEIEKLALITKNFSKMLKRVVNKKPHERFGGNRQKQQDSSNNRGIRVEQGNMQFGRNQNNEPKQSG